MRHHVPSAATQRRAEAEGLDLEAMKREVPQAYMALNAGEALRACRELADLAGSLLVAAFPDREVFRAASGSWERLLTFPPLRHEELGRLDRLLAPLVERDPWRGRHAFYRQVDDVRGSVRELGLPLAAEAYQQSDGVVGPFADEASADAWGRAHVAPPRVYDVFAMNGAWFCDVFRGDGA